MADSNTARSKHMLEKQGWSVWLVEQKVTMPDIKKPACPVCHTRPTMMFSRDAFNFADLLCFGPNGILLVQSTTVANQAARIKKMLAIPEVDGWLAAGGKIEVHGWRQEGGKGSRWRCTVQTLGLDPDFPGVAVKKEEKPIKTKALQPTPLFDNLDSGAPDVNDEDF